MMISVSLEIREGVFTRRVRITAPSIKRALNIAGEESLDASYASSSR